MNEHEVYPTAPVVLVALEVRHPEAEPLEALERRSIKSHLGKRAPLLKSAQSFTVPLGGGAPAETAMEEFPRYVNRDSTLGVSFRQGALAIESTDYVGWEDFMAVITLTFEARQRVAPVDGVERVGIRYINEIRVPDGREGDWSDWIHSSLLSPETTPPIDLPLAQWQGVKIYGKQPGRALVLRYGPQSGSAVQGNGEMKLRTESSGPYFLLDMDSYWVPEDGTPEFNSDTLGRICDELHTPIRTLFEGLVTPKLRDEVLRRDHVLQNT